MLFPLFNFNVVFAAKNRIKYKKRKKKEKKNGAFLSVLKELQKLMYLTTCFIIFIYSFKYLFDSDNVEGKNISC